MGQILELRDIHTYYGESHVLHGVSLAVDEGSVTALLGRLGMGKTTTLHSVIGFTPPRRGIVRFMGHEIQGLASNDIARMGIALVPQGRRVFPSLTVRENLTIAARNTRQPDAWSLERVYSLFPVLKQRAGSRGNRLSGGEQQMLVIARALMTNPRLVLMDEPSEGLAPLIVHELGRIIRLLSQSGISILLVEQNISLALAVSNYTYMINRGEIAHASPAEDLKRDRETQCKYLGVAR